MLSLAKCGRTTAVALALVSCAILSPSAAGGQATAYVPILESAYEDLAVLVAAGLVRNFVGGETPYSRAAFRRWTAEALRCAMEEDGGNARIHEALKRLNALYGPGAGEESSGFALRSASAELWVAHSPPRDLRASAAGGIDGELNPLLQGNQGRLAVNGWTGAAALSAEATVGRLVARATPRVWTFEGRDGRKSTASAALFDGYVRALFGSIAVEAGRNHVTMGHGSTGGAALSRNPRGLDMVRVAADRPFRLPGSLEDWGIWQASALIARMEADRDTPHSLLAIFRLGFRPGRTVELGLVYLNHQGGEGGPRAGSLKRVADLLLPIRGGAIEVSDKAGGADVRVTLEQARTQLYVNFLATDMRRSLRQFAQGYWRDALWTAGARTLGLGRHGRLDVWVEARHAGPLVHTHHQFTSGLTIDGRVIGDPLGPNAWSIAGGAAWRARRWKAAAAATWEHYSADEWRLASGTGRRRADEWSRTADNPDETRARITFDWRGDPGPGGLETSFRLGYEHVRNFGFAGQDRENFLARLTVAWRP